MSWEEDVRWARICHQDNGSPWKQLRFFRTALAFSLLLNAGLIVGLIAMVMLCGRTR
jgi:hypothetical protein